MASQDTSLQFHYKNVLGRDPGSIFRKEDPKGSGELVDKPEGFRIPLIYFSWGVLAGGRTAHHHPDNDELLIVLSGTANITLIGPGGPDVRFKKTYQVAEGDVVLFPQGWVHYLDDTTSNGKVKVMVIFNNQDFKSVELEPLKEKMALGENA